ncbi:MAG: hypothetical protein KBD05_00540 [Candidatus Pacebacteria bacterium]|nr:hypothetical protein [Candidatus Paceibacterota bacterium]
MQRIDEKRQKVIVGLRLVGKSIPEICRETGIAKTTVQRYAKHVTVPEKYSKLLREKQGGAKKRAAGLRANILENVQSSIGLLSKRDMLLLLIGLYWGEGTKRDFSIINSDPFLIQAFIVCLQNLGIAKNRMMFSLRVHSNISIPHAKTFWSKTTGLPQRTLGRVEVIEGKKKGKLPYGMCRIRVRSGIRDRLFVQTAISLIGKDCSKKVVSS